MAVQRYHTPTYAAPGTAIPREQDVVPELTAAVERAVRRRMVGDKKVGLYLSGGVGSTSLVAAARADDSSTLDEADPSGGADDGDGQGGQAGDGEGT